MTQCCYIQRFILNCLYFCLVSILDLTTLLPYLVETLVCMNTAIHIFEKKLCLCVCVQLCPTLWEPMDCSLPGCSVHGVSPARNIMELVSYHFLLHGIFLTQGLNPCLLCLLHWKVYPLGLVPPGKPGYMVAHEWVCAGTLQDRRLGFQQPSALLGVSPGVSWGFSPACCLSKFWCVVIVLVCPWEVNSESSYSTISILNQN